MEYQEKVQLKVLGYLYGKDAVNISEYRTWLGKEYGSKWNKVYNDMDDAGFIHFQSRIVESTYPTAKYNDPIDCNLTPMGKECYEHLLEQQTEESTSQKEAKSVSGWTIVAAIAGIIAAIGTLYTIYLAYHPPVK